MRRKWIFILKYSEKHNYTVGANCVRPPMRKTRTMRYFVNKRGAQTKPSLERGGGPHVSVFQFSISIFSALNYKYLLSVNDCGGGVVKNGLFRSLLCSLQKEYWHKSHATTHHSSVSPVEKDNIKPHCRKYKQQKPSISLRSHLLSQEKARYTLPFTGKV